MFQDENNIYEIAYMMCNESIKKMLGDDLNIVIDKAVDDTVMMFSPKVKDCDALKKYLHSRISREREEDEPSVLLGEEAESETWWLDYRNENNDKLSFWNRYYKYLYEEKGWERSAIKKSIDNTTDTLLNSIADPRKAVSEERRAMVVGYVQSGKTANYIGLINKALDAGYKYIIVLAGIHNNLRSQTQSRIDEEVLGYETDSAAKQKQRERAEKNKIGVGKLYNAGFVQTLTFRDEKGDFTKDRSGILTSPDNATIIVTKKIKSTLENLIENIKSNSEASVDDNGHFFMNAKYPLLLIDDEADQASVNTGSDNVQQGLYGELYLLDKLITLKGEKAVECWTGCNSETHDFYCGIDAVEVKSSSVKGPNKVNISSEYQLDDTGVLGRLYLLYLKLKKSEIDGETLPVIVERIASMLSPEYRIKFYDKLLKIGYVYQMPELYKLHFKLREENCYDVEDGFPRITAKMLNKGITSVDYTLSLDACNSFQITIESFYKGVDL